MALVEAASFADSMLAEIVRGRLASEGIDSVLFDQGLAAFGAMVPVRLMVDEEDVAAVRAVLGSL